MPFSDRVSAPEEKKRLLPRAGVGLVVVLVALWVVGGTGWLSFRHLLGDDYLPHQFCLGGDKRLVWTNALTDTIVGFSYLGIRGILIWFARRGGRKLPYAKLSWLFGIFIVSCGAAHLLEVVTLWRPVYWLFMVAKVLTAMASVCTVAFLIYFAKSILNLVIEKADIAELRGNERFRAVVQAAPMARRYKGPIDILLMDEVMPGLRVTELARQVAELHAGIHVIYMSGYAPGFLDSPIPAEASFFPEAISICISWRTA